MKLSEFKIGDMVIVTKNKDNIEDKYFPKGLVTEVIGGAYLVSKHQLTVKALKTKSTWTYLTNKYLEYCPATEREIFLYHIIEKPFVLEEE